MKIIKKNLFTLIPVCIFILTLCFTKESNAQSEWQYAKSVDIAFDPEKLCVAYIEACTSEAGDQCTQPNGAFKTCLTIPF